MDTRTQIREHVAGLLAKKGDDAPFTDSDALLASARLDSMDVLEVAEFLDGAFGITFDERRFKKDYFESIDTICALVDQSERVPG